MSEIRVTSVVGENGGDRVGLTTGLTVGPLTGTTGIGATITHHGHAQFAGVCTATSFKLSDGSNVGGGGGGYKNLIINGGCMVAQRGTSSTSGGYQTVDRFPAYYTGGAVTQSQGTLTSGTPFDNGLPNYMRITNTTANTASDHARSIIYKIEAQDIRHSGWNYKSSSSYITFSFYVRSSVSQQFYIMARTQDGTQLQYSFSIGTLSADTWTRVTHSIPGNSNLTFDNNSDRGLEFFIYAALGTDFTSSSVSLNTWGAYTSAARLPDYANTWASTTNATFDITGLQLEVGSSATAFENRTFADELRRCQRYCFRLGGGDTETYTTLAMAVQSHSTLCKSHIQFPVQMRSKDITYTYADLTVDDDVSSYAAGRIQSINSDNSGKTSAGLIFNTSSMGTVNPTRILTDDVGGYIQGECEL